MPAPELDWQSAAVQDGTLTVELAGEAPKGWKRSFETTAKLLSRGEWGAVKVKSGKVQVPGVQPGTEDKLKHFLESVVQQANAGYDDPEPHEEPADEDQRSERDGEDPDEQMTERFRSFGGDQPEV